MTDSKEQEINSQITLCGEDYYYLDQPLGHIILQDSTELINYNERSPKIRRD